MIAHPNSEAIRDLCDALDLGERVVAFTLKGRAGEFLQLEVERLVLEDQVFKLTNFVRKYDLSKCEVRE